MDAKEKSSFILEYFKSLREELCVRIEKNVNLWTLKITVAGAILAYLGKTGIQDGGLSILLLLMVPWFVVIFDFLICDNLLGIHNIANFIKHRVEWTPDGSQVKGLMNEKFWEHLCGQREESRTHDIMHLIAMFLFAFFCAAVPVIISLVNCQNIFYLVARAIIVNLALVAVVELFLCCRFEWKRYSMVKNLKEQIKGLKTDGNERGD